MTVRRWLVPAVLAPEGMALAPASGGCAALRSARTVEQNDASARADVRRERGR